MITTELNVAKLKHDLAAAYERIELLEQRLAVPPGGSTVTANTGNRFRINGIVTFRHTWQPTEFDVIGYCSPIEQQVEPWELKQRRGEILESDLSAERERLEKISCK